MSLKAPYLRKMCLPEMPKKHSPCKMGWSNPPTLAKLGSTWKERRQARGGKGEERRVSGDTEEEKEMTVLT